MKKKVKKSNTAKVSKKSTQSVFDSRVQELLPMVTVSRRTEILEYCKQQGWNITDRQIDKYIAKCKEILQKEFDTFKKDAALNIYYNRTELYKKASCLDLAVARGILSDLAKMTGVDTANIDITSKGEQLTGFIVTIKKDDE